MCAVGLDAELVKQREGIARHMVAVAVVDVDSVLGDLDAVVLVAYDARCDLLGRVRIGPQVVQRQKPSAVALGQALVLARAIHQAARSVMLLDRAPRVRRNLHDEHVVDLQL